MMAGRYAHAKQFNRHRSQLRILRIQLGRVIRDIRRKIAGDEQLGIRLAALSRRGCAGSALPSWRWSFRWDHRLSGYDLT
jgi:IS5 family transposase